MSPLCMCHEVHHHVALQRLKGNKTVIQYIDSEIDHEANTIHVVQLNPAALT